MSLSSTVFFIALAILAAIGLVVKGQPQPNNDVNGGKSSYLWRINSTPPSYLFGTIHAPYTLVWDSVSEDVKMAFDSASQVYFEIDEKPDEFCPMLPHCQHISEVIPRDLYSRLRKHLDYLRQTVPSWIDEHGSGWDGGLQGLTTRLALRALIANLEKMRPFWIAIVLTNSLNKDMIATRGVEPLDDYLKTQAKWQGKQVHGVERFGEQCNLLNGIDIEIAVFYLNETLTEQEHLRLGIIRESTVKKLIESYRQGSSDPKEFNPTHESNSNVSKELMEKMEEFDTELLGKRNKKMAKRIIDLLKKNPDAYFFAFGVLHFIGEDNIPDILRSAGFQVDQVGDSTAGFQVEQVGGQHCWIPGGTGRGHHYWIPGGAGRGQHYRR